MSLKTEFIEMGEAGDLKGLRDPPQAPAPGLFFLARAGGGFSAGGDGGRKALKQ